MSTDIGLKEHLFGRSTSRVDAKVIVLPLPWGVTASFGGGTEQAPLAVLNASSQIDYALTEVEKAQKLGIHMLPISEDWKKKHIYLRPQVESYIHALEREEKHTSYPSLLEKINKAGEDFLTWTEKQVEEILSQGKIPALLGGEHSVTEASSSTIFAHYPKAALLQIDAHMDLRPSYLGLRYSHASVMYNLLESGYLSKLVQVGVREFSPEEQKRAETDKRIHTFYAFNLQRLRFLGYSWHKQVEQILSSLPEEVYVSLDIDGLDPPYCPQTGTPAGGGLSFAEVVYLLQQLAFSGRRILGFDLVEVVPSPTGLDQNLAAQLLYRLCIYAGLSQNYLKTSKPFLQATTQRNK